MNFIELVTELKHRNIELGLTNEGRISYSVPKAAISSEMRRAVKRYKYALIDMILGQAALAGKLTFIETFYS